MILLLLCVICIGCGKKDKNEEIADEPILVIEEQEEEEDQVPEINITIPGETTTIETTNTSNASEPTKTTTTTESNSKNSKSTTNTTVINNYTTSNNTTTGTVVPNTSSSANKTSGLAAAFERIKNLATTTYTNAENWYNNDENYNYIEFNRIALRIIQEIDFSLRGIKLKISINLFGESELWIFTRSSVNKGINESYYFDEKSENIEENDNFNKYSSVIKIMKNKNSNKCFVSFGTFYQEKDNHNLYYKSFLKRQLIDYSYDSKIYNFQIDKCELDIFVTDFGEEIINAQIFLNNDKRFDDINAKFFLPINKKAKLLICGKGESLKLKDLEVKIYDKEKANMNSIIQFESEDETPKSCECCSII